jgi:hypothetical protein
MDWFPLGSLYHSPAANGLRAVHFIVDNKFLCSSNPKPLMSALGHKWTLRCIATMSALPCKADIATQRTVEESADLELQTAELLYGFSMLPLTGMPSPNLHKGC